MASDASFKPALIVVDFQEDFCPPNGAIPVPDGRSIATTVNTLLSYPFHIRIATQDWHPRTHVSFASNHAPPDNKPFESLHDLANPLAPETQRETIRLWPDHCVASTPGAALVPELDASKVDSVVKKGTDERMEMLSAFYDMFQRHVADSGLAGLLRGEAVTHVYVVGLAMDYCVRFTAVDAAKEGFRTFVVREGTKGVDEESVRETEKQWGEVGVKVVGLDGEEVAAVKNRKVG